ncbi:MAG TPA: lysylphosphatidylglycerol synthase transmembrane domain-containing protein [Anaerolineales bacterium]|nr:lysylphosphatidylglycerol synthase transmembrane domain-containing protein [Anaerolineales bacterium]
MIWFRRALSLVLFAVLVYFFWPLLEDLQDAAALFRRAHWAWLAVAILVQVISYGFLTWLNALSLQPFSRKINFLQLAGVLTSMAFIQIAIPSAGASGVAMRVRLLRKFGYAPEESLFSLMVETLLEAVALVSVASLGVFYLMRRGELSRLDLFLLALAGVAGIGLLWYGWRLLLNRERSFLLLNRLAGWWNRIGGRVYSIHPDLLHDRLEIFQQNLVHFNGLLVLKLFLAAYGKVLLDVVTLGAGFYLFGYEISPGKLYTGYGLILTMSGMAALPGGLGMADAYAPVVFSWLAVPGSVALVAGLTYRLIAFWLLRFVGFITWQILESHPKM